MVASRENFPLLNELLADQQRLDTPVARFSSAHDAEPALLSGHAAQLIPLTAPRPGEQYAFEVDLDSCTGCKSCVAACHSLNGLDDDETWRDVGTLVSSRRAQPFTQTVTTACHHCADPACLNGCPVLAYEKDPITGIVRHLDDQCIGCSYCILKCPYDVPKFSTRLGIVRKCDMCHSRLAEGEAPACAQACPTHAIRIVTVSAPSRSQVTIAPEVAPSPAKFAATSAPAGPLSPISGFVVTDGDEARLVADFLPGAPSPAYTLPTTRYVSKRALPVHLVAGDHATLRPQPSHWPLVVMLTVMPVATGLGLVAALPVAPLAGFGFHLRLATLAVGLAGLFASVFHLGQPLRAWRIFLGWRKSWLSREAMAFSAWAGSAALSVITPAFAIPTAAVGVLGLICSAMIYVDTRRHFWRRTQTFPRFFGTAFLVATALIAPDAAALALLFKLAVESRTYFDRSVSARLQRGPLLPVVVIRDICGLTALVLLVAAPGWLAFSTLLAGELAERYIFFRAVDAPKMPGVAA